MMLFRRARAEDLDGIYQLSLESGVGLTTLPKDKKILQKRLSWACDSFAKNTHIPANEYYLFVLEEPNSHRIIGTSAIEAAVGAVTPFYSYRIVKKTAICPSLNIRNDYQMLILVNDNQDKTELCTLFLHPAFRQQHYGLLLSRARFLFMSHFPHKFAATIIAELRGISDLHGHSPFWEALGQHFFHVPFAQADQLTLASDKQFIADLMPTSPIYTNLLTKEAQEAIGMAHPSTLPAMNILLKEGFYFNDYVDIFDAGPTIQAKQNQIFSVSHSQLMHIKGLSDEVGGQLYIIANLNMDFRATISEVVFKAGQTECIISKETAQLLQVNNGDNLRIVPLLLT